MPVFDDDNLPGDPPPLPPTPAARQTAPEPEAPKKHVHSSRLVKLAQEMGYSQHDLDNFPSEAIWEDIERVRAVETARKPAAPVATPTTQPTPADPDEAYLDELSQTHPDLVRVIKKALTKPKFELPEDAKEKLDRLEKAEQTRQARALDRALDDAFAALPEGYGELVGDGEYGEVDAIQQATRVAIFRAAQVDATKDGKKAIAAKIAAAAKTVAGSRVKEPPPSAYQQAASRQPNPPVHVRATPPKDPVNGRFTKEDFGAGTIHRPDGKRTGIEGMTLEEGVRQIMRKNGDPRGDRPVIDIDDNLPD